MRTKLTSSIFLNPRPPKAFGEQREFQNLRDRFLIFFGGKPYHKFLNNWSSLLQKLFGSKKVLIAYEGTATATALIRTSLPA
jgi:hypothetical protein